MNNKNILSIDLDYILAPCINLYNDLVNACSPPQNIWDTINRVRNIDKHLSYDNEKLLFVFNIFTNALSKLKNKEKVTFAVNHDAILFELSKEEHKNDKFTVYNIDHHHDIYYSEQARIEVDKYNAANVANWVWYLDKFDKLNQYNWICNENSVFPDGHIQSRAKMDAYRAEEINFIFDVENWDYIFICNSPHWCPRDYDVFFNIMITLYQNITGHMVRVEENIFSPNGIGRECPPPDTNQ